MMTIPAGNPLESRTVDGLKSHQQLYYQDEIREGCDPLGEYIVACPRNDETHRCMTEPPAILVKRQSPGEKLQGCNSFKPTTGIKDGIIE